MGGRCARRGRWQRLRRRSAVWAPQSFIRRSNADNAGVQAVDRIGNDDFAIFAVLAGGAAAWAALGQPSPWQLGLQQSATPVMDDIIWFHDYLLIIDHRHHRVRARCC